MLTLLEIQNLLIKNKLSLGFTQIIYDSQFLNVFGEARYTVRIETFCVMSKLFRVKTFPLKTSIVHPTHNHTSFKVHVKDPR